MENQGTTCICILSPITKETGTTGSLASATGMADAAEAIGRYFGTAADIPGTGEASDPYYMAVFNNSHNFDQVTPANIMKYVYLEPQQNVFDFSGADEFVALAEATDKIIRCHNLNWYQQLPRVSQTRGTALYASPQRHKDSILVHLSSCLAIATGLLKHLLTLRLIALGITNPATPWTYETLMAVLVNHIDKVMYHFGDSCYHWDVVNEAFNDDGTWRDDVWYQTSGPSYILVAFRAAKRR
ncbi:hypothetical protein B0A54_17898 [Friedmanniomyces endolithicus]|uniref:endo-1,4-beta-xylanase n=1 Tax=Friedmanniomyces endolithicus TaxID=329885 RepID=A0A4U0TN29_9PEZI|nr:hypothetical protein B0A54_17898 [Friedmanniomyces endolithicus]